MSIGSIQLAVRNFSPFFVKSSVEEKEELGWVVPTLLAFTKL
jgi:hypothetical protein